MGGSAAISDATDVFVEANGLRHHLIARGEPGRPTVMMIHGLAGQAHTFDLPAARLAEHFQVYCLDVRGRGESEWGPAEGYATDTYVADLEGVRDVLGLQEMALVGTSMGGGISTYYAAAHPEHVTKVVLNDIGPEITPAGLQRIMSYVGDAPEAFPDRKAVTEYFKEHYAPMVRGRNDEAVWELARWAVRKSDSGVLVWKMDPMVRRFQGAQPALAPWDAFKAIKAPVLILRGSESDILSTEIAGKMVEALPGTQVVEVPGVGHAPLLSEPEASEALERFLGVPSLTPEVARAD